VFALLEPPPAQHYRAGEALTFGPVTIHHQNGLQTDGKPDAWNAIKNIEVERGRFKITQKDGKHHEVRVSAIPNIELLCRLIGLNLYSVELAYYYSISEKLSYTRMRKCAEVFRVVPSAAA